MAALPALGAMFGLGGAGTFLTTVGQIVSIAAPVVGIASAVKQNQTYKAQAKEYERQAAEERIAAQVQGERMRREGRLRQSRSRAALAEGGALSGTAFGVLDQNAVAMEMDALTVEFQGEQRATGAEFNARQARSAAGPLPIFSAAIRGFNQIDPLNFAPNGGAGDLSGGLGGLF